MNKPNFTPGEWIAVGAWVEIEDSDTPDICSCNPESIGQGHLVRRYSEQCANANLIAAAPDMYAALYQILDRDECFLSEILCEFEIKDARAALAKARGENEH